MSRPDEIIDVAEAGCQLLLISPPSLDPARFARELDAVLAVGGIAGFLLRLDAVAAARNEALMLAGRLRGICADHGIAFLLRDDVTAALEVGADGVHLGSGAADVASSREALGIERILGVSCGSSRDAAMVAGDAGADYVAFGNPDRLAGQEVYDLLGWWSELFVLPCLAEVAITADDCGLLARAGADLVAAGGAVWSHPEGAAAAVRRLREALAEG
jgi:thiamine-phosphate pyrophosphorylase